MNHRRVRTRGEGFTLLETMIALSILAIGLLCMAALQIQALEYAGRGRHNTQAAILAENRLEVLMRARWTDIPVTNWTAPLTQTTVVQSGNDAVQQSYDVSWRISDVVADETRNIDVRVQWTESGGRARTYALSSMRFNHEGL